MPWKDDRKPSSEPGPWDAPGAAAPSPEPVHARPLSDKPKPPSTARPRPWDEAGPTEAPRPLRRPRLPAMIRRPRPPGGRPTLERPKPSPPADRAVPRRPASAKTPRGSGALPGGRARTDEAILKLRDTLQTALHHPRHRRTRLAVALGLGLGIACGWAASGLHEVAADQVGLVQRFGAFVREEQPGVRYRLPWPVERVRLLPVGGVQQLQGGGDAVPGGAMLTAEGAPVQIGYVVAWQVRDPQRFAFHVAGGEALLASAAEGAVRRAVGTASLDRLLDGERAPVQTAAKAMTQAAMDRLGAGVEVVDVEVRQVDPADAAQAPARDLAAARLDARAGLADIAAARDKALSAAHGEAAKALQEAQGVSDQETAEAKGEADRFEALDAAYRKAPQATRERLYTETMERVLHGVDKVIVDAPKGSTVVLPSSVVRAREAAPVSPPAAAASTASPGGAT